MLDIEQLSFMRALASWHGVASPQDLRLSATRPQDRARQKCKRAGLVIFYDGYWHLTDEGRLALRDLPPNGMPSHPSSRLKYSLW